MYHVLELFELIRCVYTSDVMTFAEDLQVVNPRQKKSIGGNGLWDTLVNTGSGLEMDLALVDLTHTVLSVL